MSIVETSRHFARVERRSPLRARLSLVLAVASLSWTAGCLSSDLAAVLPGAPAIVTQPTSREVTLGDPVSLSIAATGDSLKYQWYRGALKVDDATSATLSIASAKLTDAGVYFVIVGNSVGQLISDTASIKVVVPPAVVGYTLPSGAASSTNQAYASTTSDQAAVWVSGTGNLTMVNPTITKSGDASSAAASLSSGVNAGVRASGGGTVLVVDGKITTGAVGASGLFATGQGSHATMTRGSVATTGASSYAVAASQGATVELTRTTLRASSGTLLSATGSSTLSVLADADSLPGLVTADANSVLTLTLTHGATLSGAVQGASVSLDSTSTWNVTAASAVTSFTDPLIVNGAAISNVVGNGFTVTYDATLAANAALGGRSYTLTGGGSLVPR